MGRGILKRKNAMKKMFLRSAIKELERLQEENERLKTDPESIVGQMVPQLREALSQNNRLSVLAAALLKRQGDKVTVAKAEMEGFEGKRLRVHWELPEGVEKVEDATEYVFSYDVAEPEPTPPVTETVPENETVTIAGASAIPSSTEEVQPESEQVQTMTDENGQVYSDPVIEDFQVR